MLPAGVVHAKEDRLRRVIGAGLHIGSLGKAGVGIEGRFVYGLRDLKLDTVTSSTSYKTRSFMILGSIGT